MAARLNHLCLTARSRLSSAGGFAYQPQRLDGSHHHNQSVAGLPRCVPPSLILSGSGILTDVHHLRLSASAKDPTNPTRNDLASETLDLRRTRFSRVYTLLMPAFSLPSAPVALIDRPSPLTERSPTALSRPKTDKTHSFGTTLSPVKFSAQDH